MAPVIAPTGATWAVLENGAHHFQHGPIDLVIQADGARASDAGVGVVGTQDSAANGVTAPVQAALNAALHAAWQRFTTILPELVTELPALRRPVGEPSFQTPVARRMGQACWPYRQGFVTPMAAVAGAVADEVLQVLLAAGGVQHVMAGVAPDAAPADVDADADVDAFNDTTSPSIRRAFVNNGGDIAVYLAPGETYTVGLVPNPDALRFCAATSALEPDSRFTLQADQGIGGIATSGWRGRSFSLGIADSVTVLATTAAQADVAATLIANQVNADHPAIQRAPANQLKDDTDLGALRVTVDVGPLPPPVARQALLQGAQVARHWLASGLILGAVLVLQGQVEVVFNR